MAVSTKNPVFCTILGNSQYKPSRAKDSQIQTQPLFSHLTSFSSNVCIPFQKKASEDFLNILKLMALLIAGKKASWIFRQPQAVNEQLLWPVQRDQVFQIKDQTPVLCHF